MKNKTLFTLLCSAMVLAGCTPQSAVTVKSTQNYNLPSLTNETVADESSRSPYSVKLLPDDEPIAMSLSESIKVAQEYSLRIASVRAKVDEAQERINEVEAGYYPKLQGLVKTADWLKDRSISRSFDHYAQAQLSMQYNVFSFGQTLYGVNSASEIHQAMQQNAISEVDSVTYDTVKAYLDMRRQSILKEYATEYVQEMTSLVKTLQIRVDGGLSPRSELIRGQLALNNAQNRQKSIDLQLSRAEQELLTLLGKRIIVDRQDLDAISDKTFLEADTQIDKVLTNNPGIKARLAEVNSAKQDVLFAKAGRYPSVDVVGGYGVPFQHPDNTSGNYLGMNVAVQVSMPIFDGGVNSSRIGQSTARLRVAESNYGQLLRDMKNTTANLVNSAHNAEGIWRIQSLAEQDANQTQKLYLDEFRLGTRTLNDLLTVQTDYFSARVGRTNALYDYYLSSLGLYLLAGQVDDGIQFLNLR